MATVGHHDNPNTWLELAPHRIEFIVNEHSIETYPSFVQAIAFVAINIRDLPTMTRESKQEDITTLK